MDTAVPEIVKQLTVCFLALFNRQCLSKAFLYMYHNGPQLDESEDDIGGESQENVDTVAAQTAKSFDVAMVRALKYGALSPNGVGAKLKPYLQLAHTKGYLQPEDYEDSEFATRAVQEIYPNVLAAWKSGGELAAKKWILQYSMQMLVNPELVATEAQWAGDIDEDEVEAMIGVSHDDDSHEAMEESIEEDLAEEDQADVDVDVEEDDNGDVDCDCEICVEMRLYDDVDLGKIQTNDPLDMLMIESLRNALLRME